MKQLYKYLLILIIPFLAFSFTEENKKTKYALIVAIGDYPEETFWNDLGSIEDIPLVTEALMQQGFKKRNMIILKDSEATKKGIIDAFEKLNNKLSKGDIVAIHFSSHGQMVFDESGDELDGFDEAIVCHDAHMIFSENYQGQNHLRDDELNHILHKIRAKLGKTGDVMVTMDACHSGTITRGAERSRGNAKPLMPANYKPKNNGKTRDISIYEESNPFSLNESSNDLASMVLISAARAYQANSEFGGKGSLSTAMNKAFKGLSKNTTYRGLFARIYKEMSLIVPGQDPAIEGDKDKIMFGGALIAQEPFYKLHSLYDATISIHGGTITGLRSGSIVTVYPAETVSTKGIKPLATGKITYAEGFKSLATLDKSLDGYNAADVWIFVKTYQYGAQEIKLAPTVNSSKKWKKNLIAALDSSDFAEYSKDSPDFYVSCIDDTLSLIFAKTGKPMITAKNCTSFKQLGDILTSYRQAKFLKELEITNPSLSATIELLPVKLISKNPRIYDSLNPADFMDIGGLTTYQSGDRAKIRIKNTCSYNLYFSLVDIDNENSISVFLPKKGHNPEDYKINAGKQKDVSVIRMPKMNGDEHFVLFLSKEPLSLSTIASNKGKVTRSSLKTQIDKLFYNSYQETRNVSDDELDSDSEVTIVHYQFKINN